MATNTRATSVAALTPDESDAALLGSVLPGDALSVVVSIDTMGTSITGWQFGFTYDATKVTVKKKHEENGEHRVDLDCEVVNENGEAKVSGVAVVFAAGKPTPGETRPTGTSSYKYEPLEPVGGPLYPGHVRTTTCR